MKRYTLGNKGIDSFILYNIPKVIVCEKERPKCKVGSGRNSSKTLMNIMNDISFPSVCLAEDVPFQKINSKSSSNRSMDKC